MNILTSEVLKSAPIDPKPTLDQILVRFDIFYILGFLICFYVKNSKWHESLYLENF